MKVILPGSYDPITLGHLDIIRRAREKYDEVFVVAFINPDKKYCFSERERLDMLRLATHGFDNVTVDFFCGRVVDYMKEKGIDKIVKGYRNEADLNYERIQQQYNFSHGGYETELIICSEEYSEISSTAARDAIFSGGDLSKILPKEVIKYINDKKTSI